MWPQRITPNSIGRIKAQNKQFLTEYQMEIKQVIVINRSLNMRRGKEIAQGSHASIAFLTRRLKSEWEDRQKQIRPGIFTENENLSIYLTSSELEWISNNFTKVCLQVKDTIELTDLHAAATKAGLESHLITDNGQTEFHHEHKITALAIGPDYSEKIDKITGHLELY